MSVPAHAHLRAQTARVHAALDARFAAGLGDPRRYAVYLLGMHRLLAAFEAADPAPGRPRAAVLAADLATVGLTPLAPATLELDGEAERLGARYVIEGSALGARQLLGQLRSAGVAPAATAFLTAHADDPARWRGTLAGLQARPDADLPALTAGAIRTFALADASFALAERSLTR